MKKMIERSTRESRYLTLEGVCERYQIGRGSVMNISKKTGASIKIGRLTRYSVDILDAYFDSLRKEGEV